MGKFIVELRNNHRSTEETDSPEAYLGTVMREYGETAVEVAAPVRSREGATEFHNEREAKNALNRLPDAFFDRYWPLTVEVVDAEA